MKLCRLTDAAEDDLFDIWAYIAADNPEAGVLLASLSFAKSVLSPLVN